MMKKRIYKTVIPILVIAVAGIAGYAVYYYTSDSFMSLRAGPSARPVPPPATAWTAMLRVCTLWAARLPWAKAAETTPCEIGRAHV